MKHRARRTPPGHDRDHAPALELICDKIRMDIAAAEEAIAHDRAAGHDPVLIDALEAELPGFHVLLSRAVNMLADARAAAGFAA